MTTAVQPPAPSASGAIQSTTACVCGGGAPFGVRGGAARAAPGRGPRGRGRPATSGGARRPRPAHLRLRRARGGRRVVEVCVDHPHAQAAAAAVLVAAAAPAAAGGARRRRRRERQAHALRRPEPAQQQRPAAAVAAAAAAAGASDRASAPRQAAPRAAPLGAPGGDHPPFAPRLGLRPAFLCAGAHGRARPFARWRPTSLIARDQRFHPVLQVSITGGARGRGGAHLRVGVPRAAAGRATPQGGCEGPARPPHPWSCDASPPSRCLHREGSPPRAWGATPRRWPRAQPATLPRLPPAHLLVPQAPTTHPKW